MTDLLRAQLQEMLNTPEPPELGPKPRPGVRSEAELDAELKSIFQRESVSSATAALIRALILLWHDNLDASHTISQSIENVDGSLLHAIMHRREPDYWNSKYWWRRVGQHPCFDEIGKQVSVLLKSRDRDDLTANVVPRGKWNADAFVDACEAAAEKSADAQVVQLLREVQRIESQVALEYFLRKA